MQLVKKGLNIPISGQPKQSINEITSTQFTKQIAVLGADYNETKAKMLVQVGDEVKIGTPLFLNKDNPSVNMVSPCSGVIASINRGYRRLFESIIIDNDGKNTQIELTKFSDSLDADNIKEVLLESGQWLGFKTRPFSVVPSPEDTPRSIFVNAMDTNPLALNPQLVINAQLAEFNKGLSIISQLSQKIFVCSDSTLTLDNDLNKVSQHLFSGVHPAGLAGTHIHYLDPIGLDEQGVWTINYQEVIAIGSLFLNKKIDIERFVSLAGPCVKNPRIIKTQLGACLNELTKDELASKQEGSPRLISGSVLSGHNASKPSQAFLGRHHLQITALAEGVERPMLHYLVAGKNRFSKIPIYLSFLAKNRLWDFTTTTNGSDRAMIPIGIYEEVMPLDILPTQLLRALIVGDVAVATQLGCLELDEEDLALCTFVCPGKYDYSPILRNNLARIRKEG